jgi:hypoxanthine phosphoribosyltransferase
METIMTILTWLGYAFAVVGFLATVYKSVQAWVNLNVLSWRDVDKLSKRVIRNIDDSGFCPDIIVTIGRGGAVFGSVLSGNLSGNGCRSKKSNVPILGVDRMYTWENGQRIEVPNELVDFDPLTDKRVLLVAGDVLSGGTMRFHLDQLKKVGVAEVRTACLVKGAAATLQPNFVGKKIPADFRMPWMYKGYGYVRDSRRPTGIENK